MCIRDRGNALAALQRRFRPARLLVADELFPGLKNPLGPAPYKFVRNPERGAQGREYPDISAGHDPDFNALALGLLKIILNLAQWLSLIHI